MVPMGPAVQRSRHIRSVRDMVFLVILMGLTPSFLMVGLGGLLRRRLSPEAWQGLDRLNFEVLFPALLFFAACGRPITFGDLGRIGPAVWAVLLVALALGVVARGFGPKRFLDFAGAWQTAWRFNSAIAFVAVQTVGPDLTGQMAVAIGMAVPVANVLAVTALSRGGSLSLGQTLLKIALNPFLIASVAGVAVGLSDYKLPDPILAPAEMLAQAAIPIALLSIGATMNWEALARLNAFHGYLCLVRLVLVPLVVFLACVSLPVADDLAAVLILFAALPTASAAHVLASAFGADRELAATLIAQSTLLSALSLPAWILLIKLVFLTG
ncbi:AEC family transporter [Phaeobacter italicus]|uniref:AEC family transporter n=1 Tax=Phaeobacter italicus TaxID=481446 RepID=UPI001CD4F64C|nr:AEC family transporter [Phaeobacter italicus]MCA0858177.1 AEC family transporter [Phaeobacter italicus]